MTLSASLPTLYQPAEAGVWSRQYRGNRSGPIPAGTAWLPYPYDYGGTSEADALKAMDILFMQQVRCQTTRHTNPPRFDPRKNCTFTHY